MPIIAILLCFAVILGAQVTLAAPDPATSEPSSSIGSNVDLWSIDARLQSPSGQKARQAFMAGDVEACLSHLDALAKQQPALPPPSLLLAEICFSMGQISRTQQLLEQAAAKHPDHPEVFLVAGQLELRFGRLSNAWLNFQRARKLKPPTDWPRGQAAQLKLACYQGLAEVAERRSNWEDAVEAFNELRKLMPESPAVIERSARALLLSGNSAGALEELRFLKERDATRRPPELAAAALYGEAGNHGAAETWYRKALELYPSDGQIDLEFAAMLVVTARLDQAKVHLDKAVAKGSPQLADIAMLRGLLAMGEKDLLAAEARFTEVLRQRPGDFDALRRLPVVLVAQPDEAKKEQALQLAKIQSDKHPQLPEPQATLAWVQLHSGKRDAAQQTLAKSPRGIDPETLYLMAYTLVQLGDTATAKPLIVALQTQLKRPGWFPQRADAEEWLKTVALALD